MGRDERDGAGMGDGGPAGAAGMVGEADSPRRLIPSVVEAEISAEGARLGDGKWLM